MIMKILLRREYLREQVLLPYRLFGRLLHNFNGFCIFILSLCRNNLFHRDGLIFAQKKRVLTDNVLYTSVFGSHLLMVSVALCGCSCLDSFAHEDIDPLLLFLLSRERKKMSLLGKEVYVSSVLGVVPVVHIILLISPFAMLVCFNCWFIGLIFLDFLATRNCIAVRLIFNLNIFVDELVAKVHFPCLFFNYNW